MSDPSTIGDRLARLRGDRGLSQEELAEKAGLSRDLISMLERNVRTSPRLSTVSKLAHALDVEVGELVDRRDHLKGDRDGGSVLAVRDVLLNASLLPGIEAADDGEPTPLEELEANVSAGWEHYWSGRFGEVLAMLPTLIGEARLTHSVIGARGVQSLALAYDLASSLMTQIGRTDLGIVAAERAITVAHDGDDELLWAVLHAGYSWVLLHQGRYRESEQLNADMAQRVEPSFRDGELEIGVWGKLLLGAVAPSVARDRDPAEYLSLAGAGAERVGRPVRVYGEAPFAAATVHMQAVYGYSVLKRPGKALESAARIRPGDLRGISWGAHQMDVAQAHTDAGHLGAAKRALLEARQVSPVWFRHQRVAREAAAEIREREARLSPELKSILRSLDL
jgi:transcriptional regulator with XRE-family HTH domain